MTIRHSTTKTPGERGFASEWNAGHLTDPEDEPKRSVTLIVAAVDSLDTSHADYICDGSDDQDEINTAMGDLPASGGEILLLEGNYLIEDSVVIPADNVKIRGCGRGTLLKAGGTIAPGTDMIYAETRDSVILSDFEIDGDNKDCTGTELKNCTNSVVERILVSRCNYGIFMQGAAGHSNIINRVVSFTNTSAGIFVLQNYRCKVALCDTYSNAHEGILVSNSYYTSIVNNISTLNSREGIDVDNSYDMVINGNQASVNVRHGIYMFNVDNSVISNNVVYGNDSGNSATYDGIHVTGGSDNNVISSNRCRENDRDEIRIDDAASDKNIITGNVCLGADHVAAIVDNGTNTHPNGASGTNNLALDDLNIIA